MLAVCLILQSCAHERFPTKELPAWERHKDHSRLLDEKGDELMRMSYPNP